jgi:uncharacterized protein (DUF2252 family)
VRRRAPDRFAPLAERLAWGKSRRKALPRVAQALWRPGHGRPDPVDVLLAASHGRVPELLPIKWGRMAQSPFGFFRGAVPVMARDLGTRPVSGLTVQMCGDAHVRNLGAFASADGRLVFDINDFDETLPGPWEWDLKRLAASFVLAGREAGARKGACADAVAVLVGSWRETLWRCARMPAIEVARVRVRRLRRATPVHDILQKAERATPAHAVERLTVGSRARRRFVSRPPLLRRVPPTEARRVLGALVRYRDTVADDRRLVLDAYRPVDVAFKVVGTGSVGTRDYAVLCFGAAPDDPLVLQVKEEPASAWSPYLRRAPGPRHEGRRVAQGQHRMQTLSDPFLGWTALGGRDYLVRQLADHKAGLEPGDLDGGALLEYARVCGEVFGIAHSRTGDAAALAGYAGNTARLDDSLATFALAYAEQTEEDHETFVRAIRAGRLRERRI